MKKPVELVLIKKASIYIKHESLILLILRYSRKSVNAGKEKVRTLGERIAREGLSPPGRAQCPGLQANTEFSPK